MDRAYSFLEIKTINEDERFIEGIATTPDPDRVGDVVDPMGAQFKNPMPLLWMHQSNLPVGEATFGKPTKNGIPFKARIAKIDEPGNLKDRLDEAWQSVKAKLVKAVSIGFRSLEHSMLKDGGIHFIKTEILELSLVVIPANQNALITSIKSIDKQARAALGQRDSSVVRLANFPGATGQKLTPRGKDMKTYSEQIQDWVAKRADAASAQDDLMKKAADAGETLSAEEQEKYDTLEHTISQIDGHVDRLKKLEERAKKEAAPVSKEADVLAPEKPARGTTPILSVRSNIEPGMRFARQAICVARAKFYQKAGHFMAPEDIYRNERRWMDTAPEVHLALKTAVNGLDSTTATAASEWAYAQNIASEFIEYLRPMTLLGKIQGWRNVPFNVRVGGMNTGSTGYWVGQGLAVNTSKATSTSVSLGITKVGGLSVITKELAMLSTPSAEMMVRNDLARALQQKADTSLIDPNNGGVTDVTPASLTYGVTARAASGTDYAAFKADWKALTSNFYANNIPLSGAVIVMKEELAEALALMVTSLGLPQFPSMQDWASGNGRLMGRPVYTTQVADTSGSPDFDNLLILIQPNEVFLADDGGASVEASDQVSIQMDDAPTNKSTATATGASVVSMFQTESIAIKAIRHVNWTKARSQACQFIRTAAYV